MFLFRAGRFGRMGPVGVAFMGYRLWQRLSPQQKTAIRKRAGALAEQASRRRDVDRSPVTPPPATMSRVGSATAPTEEIPPSGR